MIVFSITTWDNRERRWDNLKREVMGYMDGDMHPILATDWRVYTHCGLSEHKAKHLSLALAYYQIAQTAHFEGLSRYIVVEDDICFQKTFPTPIAPGDFDLIYLTKTSHNQHAVTQAYDADYALIKSNWWETPITLWSAAFAGEFIAWVRAKLQQGLWLGNIDHILMQMNDTGKYRFYGSTRKVAVGLSSEPEYGNMDLTGSISAHS